MALTARTLRTLTTRDTLDTYLKLILNAQVYHVALETPLQYGHELSAAIGNHCYYKREDMQPVFSFKLRGAYNKIAHLTEMERKRGIVACSAGNHAQGVALSAVKLGIENVIVMPEMTPQIKISAVKRLGGNVLLHGSSFHEAQLRAKEIVEKEGKTMIHPYDDPLVIAGQGTIGMEILNLRNAQDLDAIFCCVGGGGLISGVAAYVKSIRPSVRIIGVETEDANAMTLSLKLNQRVELSSVGLFADGAAVKQVGEETFRLASQFIDEMVTVNTDQLCEAIKDAFNDTRTILEPAGALAIAGMKKYAIENGLREKTFVAVSSGANMNFNRLRFVAERSDQNEAVVSVTIPETPGSFQNLYDLIFPRDVTGFSYRYSSPEKAYIIASFKVGSHDETQHVITALNENGMEAVDLSHNEMAKAHARYMVGGRSPNLENEVVYRFEFPEVPGGIKHFLGKLSGRWNVSMWHYRSHGGDITRVLAGLQVPVEERDEFQTFIDDLGYRWFNETNNAAYQHFLI